ncbi:hypothetical protein G9A89_006752 [Geosiphon pyriformis]|nr:hypothetical protein G9A89_006752 [Geosiphon pyriformis]
MSHQAIIHNSTVTFQNTRSQDDVSHIQWSNVGLASLFILVNGTRYAMAQTPFWTPYKFVPTMGMLLGNSMSGIAVGISCCLSQLSEQRDKIETYLGFGATRWEAGRPVAIEAIRIAMLPTINDMSVIGLISIPGMMTGQIIAGAPIMAAVKYQQIIMFMITASVALGVLSSVCLCIYTCIDSSHRLRTDRITDAEPWIFVKIRKMINETFAYARDTTYGVYTMIGSNYSNSSQDLNEKIRVYSKIKGRSWSFRSEEEDPQEIKILDYSDIDFIEIISRFAHWSNQAYCKADVNFYQVVSIRGALAKVFFEPEFRVIVASFQGQIFSSLQWTKRKSNLVAYKNGGQLIDRDARVDEIWFQDVEAMKDSLISLIKHLVLLNLQKEEIFIWLTGHGIGGAYAVLSALALVLDGKLSFELDRDQFNIHFWTITFGQPRIGNSKFSQFVNDELQVIRVTHTNDYVPHYPQFSFHQQILKHHQEEHWLAPPPTCDCEELDKIPLYAGLAVYVCKGIEENKKCNAGQVQTVRSSISHNGPYFGVKMRDCRSYVDRLYSL